MMPYLSVWVSVCACCLDAFRSLGCCGNGDDDWDPRIKVTTFRASRALLGCLFSTWQKSPFSRPPAHSSFILLSEVWCAVAGLRCFCTVRSRRRRCILWVVGFSFLFIYFLVLSWDTWILSVFRRSSWATILPWRGGWWIFWGLWFLIWFDVVKTNWGLWRPRSSVVGMCHVLPAARCVA